MIAFHMLPSWWWMVVLPVTWWASYKFGRAVQEIDDDEWFVDSLQDGKYMPLIEERVHQAYEAGIVTGREQGYEQFNATLFKAKSDAWDEGFNAGYEEALEDD